MLQVCWATDTITADTNKKISREQLNPNTGYWQGRESQTEHYNQNKWKGTRNQTVPDNETPQIIIILELSTEQHTGIYLQF